MTEDQEHDKFFADIKKAYENMTPEQLAEEKKFNDIMDNAVADGIEQGELL